MNIILLYSVLILFAITNMWILIKLSKTKLLFLYIPVFLAIVAYSIFVYDSILGQPRHGPLPVGKYNIAAYIVEDNKRIFLWVIPKNQGEKTPIAYVIPYQEKTHKELDGASQGIQRGTVEGEVKLKGSKSSGSSESSKDDADLNIFDFIDQIMREKRE